VSPLRRILDRAPRPPKRIVFPEAVDERVLAAAARLAEQGIVEPILAGSREAIEAAARSHGVDIGAVSTSAP